MNAAAAALVLGATGAALADEPEEKQDAVELKSEVLLSSEGLPDSDRPWLPSSFHLHKKSGFAFTHRAVVDHKPVVFRIQGPVLRKQKAVGLTFKIQF